MRHLTEELTRPDRYDSKKRHTLPLGVSFLLSPTCHPSSGQSFLPTKNETPDVRVNPTGTLRFEDKNISHSLRNEHRPSRRLAQGTPLLGGLGVLCPCKRVAQHRPSHRLAYLRNDLDILGRITGMESGDGIYIWI